ncbi:MAG TPA: hypothetical protein VGD67_26805 [Pseudonocardiaceae bacterium]
MERDAEAMRLRSRGWLLPAIAVELGYGDEANVRRALRAHTERVTGEAAAELRQAQLEELDRLTAAATKVLEAKHFAFQNGRLCTLPAAEEGGPPVPVEDDAPVLRAVETLLRIQERRAKLLGLDAPTRQEVEQTLVRYTVEGVDLGKLT